MSKVVVVTEGGDVKDQSFSGETPFGGVDYAMLVKMYGDDTNRSPERKYSP
jgi:hypothetical protein